MLERLIPASARRLLGMATLVVLLGTLPRAALAQADPGKLSAQVFDAIVQLRSEVPREARTAPYLGTEREGSGILIDADGLIVTIGYLITEAMAVQIVGPGGKAIPATVIGFDNETGLGLVRAQGKLDAKPMALGRSKDVTVRQTVAIAGFGGIAAVQPAVVMARRSFAGYWEYFLEDAIFTAPPYSNWGGAALVGADGKLLGIGSLIVGETLAGGGEPTPGNMFVPIDLLKPILGDLLSLGRPSTPPRPWLGINAQEVGGRIVVTRVTPDGPGQKAGLARGDQIRAVDGRAVVDLGDFYKRVWSQGPAGIDVKLNVTHGGETREVTVKTMDRYKYLKLDTTY